MEKPMENNKKQLAWNDICRSLEGLSDDKWEDIIMRHGLNIHTDTLRKKVTGDFGAYDMVTLERQRLLSEKNEPVDNAKEKYVTETSINKDGSRTSSRLIEMSEEETKDVNYILKAHGFDVEAWELQSAKNNIWNVYSKVDGVSTLYSSKITVKPRTGISLETIKSFYKELVSTYESPKVKFVAPSKQGVMLEVPIVDLHLGKMSFSDEVGEGYNSKLAKARFNYIIDDVISQTSGMNIEQIVFPIGNDFFNIDTTGSTTTGGTPQDCDMKWQELYKEGILMLIDGISKLKEIAPIKVFCVNGNHDFMTSFHATMTIWAKFCNDENVEVDISASPRKYVEFGNCLIGFSHGDKEKKRINGIMQIEAREAWGRTHYQEWHLGHLHSEQVKEESGIIIRNLSSVTGTDSWHHTSGYVGAVKKCQCFLWDKEFGLKGTINSIVK